ncbi:MAG: protoporphyrinogen oxidase HemJ [Proteobacteria bacterium]|nr:protoporphyrinogen oxidase HemJ [Pseudomonadota bacterium]
MSGFLVDARQWILALHILAVIAWMAGMLYLPRLFVYHADAAPGSDKSETFKVMERRLLRGIINPAMIATWTFGLLLVFTPGVVNWSLGWPWAKGALVILMSAVHGLLSRWRRDFAADRNTRPARFFRWVNEVPTVLLIGIVVLVVVKPF